MPAWASILFLTVGWYGVEMAMALHMGQFQLRLHEHLGQAFLVGLVMSMGPLMGFTVQPAVGYFSDRLAGRGLSHRLIIGLGVLGGMAALLWLAWTEGLTFFLMGLVLFYFSFNVVQVVYRALMTVVSGSSELKERKGRISGMAAFFATMGTTSMFILGGWLSGTPYPFLLAAGILLVVFILFFVWAPRPAEPEESRIIPPRQLFSPWHLCYYALPLLNAWAAYERRISAQDYQRDIFRLFTVIFFAWMGLQALRGFFVLYAQALGFDETTAQYLLAVISGGIIVAALPIGRWTDRWDLARVFRFFLVAFAVLCGVAFWWVASLWQAVVFCFLAGVVLAGVLICPLTALLKLCPEDQEGSYSGLYNIFLSVPQFYSFLITGWLLDQLGYEWVPLIGGLLMLIAYVFAFRLNIYDNRS